MSCSRTQHSNAGEAPTRSPLFRGKHSTTEPLCSLPCTCTIMYNPILLCEYIVQSASTQGTNKHVTSEVEPTGLRALGHNLNKLVEVHLVMLNIPIETPFFILKNYTFFFFLNEIHYGEHDTH